MSSRGGAGRLFNETANYNTTPVQHGIDVALAQAAYKRKLAQVRASRIKHGSAPLDLMEVFRLVRDVCRSLGRSGNLSRMSERQREVMVKILGEEEARNVESRARRTFAPRPSGPTDHPTRPPTSREGAER